VLPSGANLSRMTGDSTPMVGIRTRTGAEQPTARTDFAEVFLEAEACWEVDGGGAVPGRAVPVVRTPTQPPSSGAVAAVSRRRPRVPALRTVRCTVRRGIALFRRSARKKTGPAIQLSGRAV
jgi:hypothetical protein